jgi:hypothetical protein
VESNYGKSWISFIGAPALTINIDPSFGESKMNLKKIPFVEETFRQLIFFTLRKMTYPNKNTMKIPMTYRNKDKQKKK